MIFRELWRRWPKWVRVSVLVASLASMFVTGFLILSLIPPRLFVRIETDRPVDIWMGEYRIVGGVVGPRALENVRLLGPSPQEVEIPLKRDPMFWQRVFSRILPMLRPPGVYGNAGNFQTAWPLDSVALIGIYARDWVPMDGNPGFRFSVGSQYLKPIPKVDEKVSPQRYAWNYRIVLKVPLE